MLLLPVVTADVVSSQQQSQAVELVDSGNTGGVDVFSDTTSTDTAGQTVVVPAVTDGSILDGDITPGMFFGSFMVLSGIVFLFLLGIMLLPIIAILLFLWFLVRRKRRKPQPVDPLNDLNRGRTSDNHQQIEIEKMEKKLRRSQDQILGGVCAGLAEYFDLDPTVVRIAYVLLTVFTAFSGVIIYLVLLLLMPRE